ncbi:G5 domain protein [[Clostridium] methylpentosum DSM 5476]|uniref:G5 domain protein n=1 Tax=[Clostridium] methylpentosum DSM 5476 TaxID=537013 RepID=C0EC13_9FIRM|nr:G5 domain protein [[Clostridium] methylpentosum DSM 5476]MDY3989613.1 G5 domain-containing protein [Massilioclostridium sp.]MEE1491271.1 G5 domain-containing protein [Massilioclostridium sp.]
MQSFLKKLRGVFIGRAARIITISVLCVSLMGSSCILTGIAYFRNSVTIQDGEEQRQTYTMKNSCDEILEELGINLSAEDEVVFTGIENNRGTITINRAFEVSVTADGQRKTVSLVRGTVQDVLEKAGVTIEDDDIINYALDQEISKGAEIEIQRVSSNTYTTTEAIPYNTVQKETDKLDKGVTQVETAGQEGERTYYYQQELVDGEVVSDQLVSSEVTREPVDEVILVGTYVEPPKPVVSQKPVASGRTGKSTLDLPASLTLDGNGIPTNYTNVLTGRACAYTAPAGAKGSTGQVMRPGYVAVNPNVIPYGSKLYIVSADGKYVYGYAIAADTGGSLMANDILADLFMNTSAECYEFGSRTVNIYILP